MSVERMRISIVSPLAVIIMLSGCAGVQSNSMEAAGGAVFASRTAEAAPTFYADALPVFQKNCVACHQPDGPMVGGISAPMPLTTSEAARPWAARIKRALETGYMPPWGAHVQHQGTFKDERYISDADKSTVIAWVDAGAPAGEEQLINDVRPAPASRISRVASSRSVSSSRITVGRNVPR